MTTMWLWSAAPGTGCGSGRSNLEWRGADRQILEVAGRALRDAGAQFPGQVKLATALGRETPPPADLGRRVSWADLIQSAIDTGLGRLLDHEIRLRLDPEDPPGRAVHQARVATRRLRSDLKTFGSALDPMWLRHTRDDLQWLGTVLGRVRDVDVLREGMSRDLAAFEAERGTAVLVSSIGAERRRAASDLTGALTTQRYLDLLDRLHAAARTPPFIDARADGRKGKIARPDDQARHGVSAAVKKPWRSLRRAVRDAGAQPSAHELHQIRIKAKRLRYASEAAVPLVGKPARRTARAAEALQTLLGEHHDAVSAELWLSRNDVRANDRTAFVAGKLVGQQRWRQMEVNREWRGTWAALRKQAKRWPG